MPPRLSKSKRPVVVRQVVSEAEYRGLRPAELQERYGLSRASAYRVLHEGRPLYQARELSPGEAAEARRRRVFEKLEAIGVLEMKEAVPVVDLEALRALSFERMGVIEGAEQPMVSPIPREVLFDVLKYTRVISKEDWMHARRQHKGIIPKPLFNLPDSEEQAFDLGWMGSQYNEHYLDFWDLGRKQSWDHAFTLRDGSTLRLDELYLTTMSTTVLERDESTGKLSMFDAEGAEHNFSASSFTRLFKNIRTASGQSFADSPLEYLRSNCPRLLTRGIFKVTDFRSMQENAGALFRKEKTTGEEGTFYLGTHYTLGKKYGHRSVVALSKKYAALLDPITKQPETIIVLASPQEITDQKIVKGGLTHTSFPRKEGVHIFPYAARLPGEGASDYLERQVMRTNWYRTQSVSQELTFDAGVGIHDALSWREQQWVEATMVNHPEDRDRVTRGAKKYGRNFLRAFVTNAYGEDESAKILSLTNSEYVPQTMGTAIFAKYAELADSGENVRTYIADTFPQPLTDAQVEEIRGTILRRGKKLLVRLAEELPGVKEERRVSRCREVIDGLRSMMGDMLLFAACYKEALQTQALRFEDIKGVQLVTKRATELTAEERETMRAIFRANRADQNLYTRAAVESEAGLFEEALFDPQETFYLLTKASPKGDDEIVSYLRVKKLSATRVHVGGFNVRPSLREFALGPGLITTVLREKAPRAVAEGTVAIQNPALHLYLKLGAFAHRVRYDSHSRKPYVEVMRHPELMQERISPRLSPEEIVRASQLDGPQEKYEHPYRVVMVPWMNDSQLLAKMLNRYFTNGYVLSRTYMSTKEGLTYLVFEQMDLPKELREEEVA